MTMKATATATATVNAKPSLLRSIPKDVLARDILGFLTDKAVKTFLDSVGEERLDSPSCTELRQQFCPRHGSRLEDPETFCISGSSTNAEAKMKTSRNRKRACPECYAEQQNSKRCNGCKVFYPRFNSRRSNDTSHRINNNDDDAQDQDQAIIHEKLPGLWCQRCDRMAFCNACISNEEDGCGSEVAALRTRSDDFSKFAFGAFGRKCLPAGRRKRNYCDSGRITCHNYCCPNVFTNTMCGEFVCDDCGDERQRLDGQQPEQHDSRIETCDDCGKATCLDPNCLVCADFRLINMSCKFSPEDAYRMDLGGILWGSKNNGSNSNLSTIFRRNLSDGMVFIGMVFFLSKMWGFQK